MNEVWIKSLRVHAQIGVSAEEREALQELHVDLCIQPPTPFSYINDDITRTIDYQVVADRVSALAGESPRHLIETLAADIGRLLIEEFHAVSVTVEVRKFILPGTDWVATRCRLER